MTMQPAWTLLCDVCGQAVSDPATRWRCPCGGPLDLPRSTTSSLVEAGTGGAGLWRYRSAFPAIADGNAVTLGEGLTPLLPARHRPGLSYKLDYLFPTGSFKDRGTTVLASCLRQLGIERAVEDSSGNAGASMAAYFAAAGIAATIFVPAATSPGKTDQIRAFGADLRRVEGSRADVTQAAMDALDAGYYASHLWSPYFLAGTMTVAFELWEQLDQRVPDVVIVPAGGGTLLLGAYLGFQHLMRAGLTSRMPTLIGAQAERFAPLYRAFEAGRESTAGVPFDEGQTWAEGIRLRDPPRSRQMLRAVRETGGWFEPVPEAEIRAAWRLLARQGLYVEPTAAVAPAAAERIAARGAIKRDQTTVVVLTGSGLKGVAGMLEPEQPVADDEEVSLGSSRPA
jgi:threonine synthase